MSPFTRRWRAASIAGGVALAAMYTVTPLTVCVLAAGAAILPRLVRGLPPDERRWITAIIAVALIARLIGVGALFARNMPSHDDQFVGAASGDEAYAMSRALRTRDILRGSPTGKYDYFIAFDEYGRNSFVTALTASQLFLGPTPYAIRLLNTLLFTVGVLLMFHVARRAFGALPAGAGLLVLLFWPTLFAWSISLLKEPLYFLLAAIILTSTIGAVRDRGWRARAIDAAAAAAAAVLVRDLRPGTLLLVGTGLSAGFAVYLLAGSRRTIAMAAAIMVVIAVALSRPAVEGRVIRGLEAAAKTHSGHVFTVGHDYKLLDAGFYVNPRTPAASTLTLTRAEAARFVARGLASFFVVPLPWQTQSVRELAYLPEQMAWYALVALLPIGVIAAYRRDRLVTCMLVCYAAPTAVALALTNGNVGTLLRLRGLVIPYLVWISAVGFCTALGALGRKERMPLLDENGRVFGRLNLFDAALAAFVVLLIPAAYGTYLLFRTAAPRIESVTRVAVTPEERRVAGGSRLTAKLKVRGSGLRPMLRASIGTTQAIGFVFEDPNSADVLVGGVPAGTHDLVLYDGVQEVARLPRSVTIESSAAARIAGVGTLVHLNKATADALAVGELFPGGAKDAVVKLGPAKAEPAGGWERRAEILLQCDAEPNEEGCVVSGLSMASNPLPVVRLNGPSGTPLSFALTETFPTAAPARATATARFTSAQELVTLVRVGDRDDTLDERAATVAYVTSRPAGTGAAVIDLTLRVGVDSSPEGWRYRGRLFKPGTPFRLTTERYMLEGIVVTVGNPEGEAR